MHQILFSIKSAGSGQNSSSDRWFQLPGLCCSAAGGDPNLAEDLAVAWYLFYIAADLMDKIEDKDELTPVWTGLRSGVALNIASGLYFSASLVLNNLHDLEELGLSSALVIADFYRGFLSMCGGQHLDLVFDQPSLEQFWETVAAKSGSFFSMACRLGACLATNESLLLDGYGKFGHHLGILIQIFDELEELKNIQNHEGSMKWDHFMRSLPVIYASEVYPPTMRDRLKKCIQAADQDPQSAEEVLELINQSGAVLYIRAEIERHREGALSGLSQASPSSPSGETLHALLDSLYHLIP